VLKSDITVVKSEPVVISDEDIDDGSRLDSKPLPAAVISSCVASGFVSPITSVPRLTYHPRPLAVSIGIVLIVIILNRFDQLQ